MIFLLRKARALVSEAIAAWVYFNREPYKPDDKGSQAARIISPYFCAQGTL
jgi:hypothetical protein